MARGIVSKAFAKCQDTVDVISRSRREEELLTEWDDPYFTNVLEEIAKLH